MKLSPSVLRHHSAHGWIMLLVLVLFSLTACAQSSSRGLPKSIQWQEEVQLSDGRGIIVTFVQKTGAGLRREPLQPDPVGLVTLTFNHPDTHERIYWETRWGFEPDKKGLSVINLDIVDGHPYLVSMPIFCIDYNKVGRPNPPYVIFKFQDDGWQRISIDVLPGPIKRRNLMGRMLGGPMLEKALNDGYLSVVDKGHWMDSGLSKESIQIYRQPTRSGNANKHQCERMFFYGSGWRSSYLFEHSSSLKDCIKLCSITHINNNHCPCSRIFTNRN